MSILYNMGSSPLVISTDPRQTSHTTALESYTIATSVSERLRRVSGGLINLKDTSETLRVAGCKRKAY